MKIKNKKIFWIIALTVLIIVSCDQDAFRHLQNAATFFNLGMYEQALIELKTSNRFLKDTPEFQQSIYKYLMWGIISLKEGNQKKSIEYFSAALKIEPGEEQIRFILSSLYLQQKEFTKAIELFSDPKYLDITYGAPDYLQGIKSYYAGNLKAAIKYFENTLETINEEYIYFSDNPSQKIVIEQLRLVLFSMLGEAYLQLNNYKQAIKYYTKALELDQKNIILDAKLKIAMLSWQTLKEPKNSGLYATIGYYYSILNLNDKAIYFYEKALSIYPQSSPAWLGVAIVYKNKLDYTNAKRALEKGLSYAKEPKIIASIYLNLGQIYATYDNLNQALEILNKAKNLDPENISITNDLDLNRLLLKNKQAPGNLENNLALASSYLERKNYNLARQHYNFAIKISPENTEAQLGLARLTYLEKNYQTSLSYYKRILKNDPENIKALYGIADVYMAEENFNIAISTIKKALSKDEENILLRHKLAYLYFYSGQNSEAIKEFNFVKNNINNEEMISVIDKIIEVIS